MAGPAVQEKTSGSGILGLIERIGNKLPDPVFLFIGATVIVMALSAIGSSMGWSVQPQRVKAVMEAVTLVDGSVVQQAKLDASGKPVTELVAAGGAVSPRNLLSVDGAYWLLANAVRNFINFAPLGVVLVGMFGIGVAEKVGLFGATMRWVASFVPSKALTPTIVFLGVVSNIASDAGYIVLPPLAAALYAAFKRPPLVGIAAAFAGVSAGFSANLLVGSTDALVAGITTLGARTLEPTYTVLATANWWFLIVSTFLLTLIGWGVTAWVVEPRLERQGHDAEAMPRARCPLRRRLTDRFRTNSARRRRSWWMRVLPRCRRVGRLKRRASEVSAETSRCRKRFVFEAHLRRARPHSLVGRRRLCR